MRNLVAALVFVIAAAAFAGARTPADEDAHRTAAVEEPVVESTCEHCVQAAEDVEPTQKRARPAWLTDYSTHIGIIGVLSQIPGSPPREEAEPVERPRIGRVDGFAFARCAGELRRLASRAQACSVERALIAAFEIFRPAPAMTQPSVADQMRNVVYELRGIRQELAGIQRKMK